MKSLYHRKAKGMKKNGKKNGGQAFRKKKNRAVKEMLKGLIR